MALTIILFVLEFIPAQTVYKLPFASVNNRIELTVSNTASIIANAVTVAVDSKPSWIIIKSDKVQAGDIAVKNEKVVSFNFDVDKKAPVGKTESIVFKITSQSGEQWTKEIKVTAGAPDKYELFQNYPNPFNPTTTISYQLPFDSKVLIKVYDILGREVSTLFDGEQKAGYYENKFPSGGNISSGVYIYRLSARSDNGKSKEYNSIKKMMMIK